MKKHSILFLICFILLTFAPVPVFYLFREQIGYKNTENKAESPLPELNVSNYSTWPKRFEEWFSDNLPFKTQFIELYRGFQLHAGLDFSQSDVIRGKDDMLFYRKTVENYKGITRFSEKELEQLGTNLSAFFEQMEHQGTKCLLYIAPDKEQIYPTQMPEYIKRVSTESRADQVVSYLNEHVTYPVRYPKAELQSLNSSFPVYFITDTHWNELAGWFAENQIRSIFTGEAERTEPPQYHYYESEGKDLAGMLGLSEQVSEPNAVLLDFDDNIQIWKPQTINHGEIQRYVSDAGTDKKLLVIGDSFSESFVRSAIHDVDEVLFVTYGSLYQIDLQAEAPDYLVVMLVERNLPFLLNGFY